MEKDERDDGSWPDEGPDPEWFLMAECARTLLGILEEKDVKNCHVLARKMLDKLPSGLMGEPFVTQPD